jgi:hypothetical protein
MQFRPAASTVWLGIPVLKLPVPHPPDRRRSPAKTGRLAAKQRQEDRDKNLSHHATDELFLVSG